MSRFVDLKDQLRRIRSHDVQEIPDMRDSRCDKYFFHINRPVKLVKNFYFLTCHMNRGKIHKPEFRRDGIIAIAIIMIPLTDHIVALNALQT